MTYVFSCDSINSFRYYSGGFSSYSPRSSYANPFLFSFASGDSYGPRGNYGTSEYYGPRELASHEVPAPKLRQVAKSYAPLNFGAVTEKRSFAPVSYRSSAGNINVGNYEGDAMFDKALDFVLAREGGYANIPGDSGGATNKGITQRTYNAWLKKNGLPRKNVRNITDAEVRTIYYNEFWKPLGCSKLPSNVAMFIFDTGVNMGTGRAREYLRRYNNGESLNSLMDARENKYRNIAAANPSKQKFLNGWMNRMGSLRTEIAIA